MRRPLWRGERAWREGKAAAVAPASAGDLPARRFPERALSSTTRLPVLLHMQRICSKRAGTRDQCAETRRAAWATGRPRSCASLFRDFFGAHVLQLSEFMPYSAREQQRITARKQRHNSGGSAGYQRHFCNKQWATSATCLQQATARLGPAATLLYSICSSPAPMSRPAGRKSAAPSADSFDRTGASVAEYAALFRPTRYGSGTEIRVTHPTALPDPS